MHIQGREFTFEGKNITGQHSLLPAVQLANKTMGFK
jgi:hypothetical protein